MTTSRKVLLIVLTFPLSLAAALALALLAGWPVPASMIIGMSPTFIVASLPTRPKQDAPGPSDSSSDHRSTQDQPG